MNIHLLLLKIFLFLPLSHRTFAQADFWEPTNGPLGTTVLSLALDSAGRILAGTANDIQSKDVTGGEWSYLGLGGRSVTSIAVHPSGLILAGTSIGVFRSTDNGASWVGSDLSASVSSLALSPNGYVFALVGSSQIYRSSDLGLEWTYLREGWSPAANSSGEVFAISAFDTLMRTTDNGDTWETLSLGPVYGLALALCVSATDEVYLGTIDSQ